jgi:hypothetical protein
MSIKTKFKLLKMKMKMKMRVYEYEVGVVDEVVEDEQLLMNER